MEYYFVYMTGLAGKDRGYWNAVNSAKLFSQLNPYFIFMDSLTLFPDTELYRMEREGKFTPAGEKERIEELQVFRIIGCTKDNRCYGFILYAAVPVSPYRLCAQIRL